MVELYPMPSKLHVVINLCTVEPSLVVVSSGVEIAEQPLLLLLSTTKPRENPWACTARVV